MSNIYEFPGASVGPSGDAPPQRVIQVDGNQFAFAHLHETKRMLEESLTWEDPTTLIRIVCRIAHSMLGPDFSERQAIAAGWASYEVARQRAIDLIELVGALPSAPLRQK